MIHPLDHHPHLASLNRPLVLVGLMGAGKSTVGRRLTKAMARPFMDSDEEIERAAACSIADLFAIHGEPIFRDLEERVIFRLLQTPDLVLATGGGAWMQPSIRTRMKQEATTVWLRAELDTLLERVERRNTRPLLASGDKRAILERLMDERYPIYAEADVTIDSSDHPHEDVVERIMKGVEAHLAQAVQRVGA